MWLCTPIFLVPDVVAAALKFIGLLSGIIILPTTTANAIITTPQDETLNPTLDNERTITPSPTHGLFWQTGVLATLEGGG
jgi:hypothetical protein